MCVTLLNMNIDIQTPKPLCSPWSLWEHQRNSYNNYDKNTCCIGTFSSVQDFWRYYNNYPQPTKIFYTGTTKPKLKNPDREIASLSLFRHGIEPKWEHDDNNKGGEFALRNFNNIEDIDKMWELLSVYCIGELFQDSDQITGIRVVDSSIPTSKRALHRIEIWFRSLEYKDSIEKFFRNLLHIEPFVQVHFKEHSTAVESFIGKIENKQEQRIVSDRVPVVTRSMVYAESVGKTQSVVSVRDRTNSDRVPGLKNEKKSSNHRTEHNKASLKKK